MPTIGLIRERKAQPDNRVALTPDQCRQVMENHNEVQIKVEPSEKRCFPDKAYQEQGIPISSDVSDADWLIGVKEVPPEALWPQRTYTFFSHTIKKQAYNKKLLQTILEKHIRLIDLELLVDENGNRLIGFGNYAGIVGAHYGLLMYGKRHHAFHLYPAHQMADYHALVDHVQNVNFNNFKLAIAGNGRAGQGARTYLKAIGLKEVHPDTFRNRSHDEPVFTLLSAADLYQRKDGQQFDKETFKTNPENHASTFDEFIPHTDILVNTVYWDHDIPRHFKASDTRNPDFRISSIADVSCDLEGAIPINLKHSTSSDPVYGYEPDQFSTTEPYKKGCIDVMAISNLPNELPCDASSDFGAVMRDMIIPAYKADPWQRIFQDATIADQGQLMPDYQYLQDFVSQ